MTIQHSEPAVWAIFEFGEYGLILSGEIDSVWAYMTYQEEIIADCLLVTTLDPALADEADMEYYEEHDAPPPLTSDYATPLAYMAKPDNAMFRVLWSPEGREVLVALNNQVHAYINADEDLGYSKALKADGPYGQSWRDFPISHITQPSTEVIYD